MFVIKIPNTIVNWLIATILPLKGAGAISPIYNGESIEAIPTPIPATNRESINESLPGANEQ